MQEVRTVSTMTAALPGLAGGAVSGWWFAVLVPVGLLGAVLAWRLSPAVEAGGGPLTLSDAVSARSRLGRRAGWCTASPGCSPSTPAAAGWSPPVSSPTTWRSATPPRVTQLGWLFFTIAGIQAVSVTIAPR